MTDLNLNELLREVAELRISSVDSDGTKWADLRLDVLLALLDRVAELEAKVARVESLAETATRWRDHWQDGIPRPEPLHAVEELVLELAALAGESDE